MTQLLSLIMLIQQTMFFLLLVMSIAEQLLILLALLVGQQELALPQELLETCGLLAMVTGCGLLEISQAL
jgi:hypothetical protein